METFIALLIAGLASSLLIWAPIGGYLAQLKGRSLWTGYLAGLALGPLGLALLWFLPHGSAPSVNGETGTLQPLVVAACILIGTFLAAHFLGNL